MSSENCSDYWERQEFMGKPWDLLMRKLGPTHTWHLWEVQQVSPRWMSLLGAQVPGKIHHFFAAGDVLAGLGLREWGGNPWSSLARARDIYVQVEDTLGQDLKTPPNQGVFIPLRRSGNPLLKKLSLL